MRLLILVAIALLLVGCEPANRVAYTQITCTQNGKVIFEQEKEGLSFVKNGVITTYDNGVITVPQNAICDIYTFYRVKRISK